MAWISSPSSGDLWKLQCHRAACNLCVFAGSQSCWVLSQWISCSILCMNTITHWILTTWPKHTTTVRTYTVNAVHLHKSKWRYIVMLYICLSLQCLWRDKCVLDSTGCWLKQEGLLGQRLKPLWSITVKTPSHSVWSALTTSSGGTLQGCLSLHWNVCVDLNTNMCLCKWHYFHPFLLCSGIEQPKQILSLQQTNSTKIKQEQEEQHEESLGTEVTTAELKEEAKAENEKKKECVIEELHDSLKGEPEALTVADPVLTLDITSTGLNATNPQSKSDLLVVLRPSIMEVSGSFTLFQPAIALQK